MYLPYAPATSRPVLREEVPPPLGYWIATVVCGALFLFFATPFLFVSTEVVRGYLRARRYGEESAFVELVPEPPPGASLDPG